MLDATWEYLEVSLRTLNVAVVQRVLCAASDLQWHSSYTRCDGKDEGWTVLEKGSIRPRKYIIFEILNKGGNRNRCFLHTRPKVF